jgi:diamine N-acetyltransferase
MKPDMIKLVKISEKNFDACVDLYDTLDEVQKKDVAPNVESLAQAYLYQDKAWPRVIMNNKNVIGFLMLELNTKEIPEYNQPGHYLWRFMIGKPYQGKGYGKRALQLVIEKCKKEGMKSLYVSCDMNTTMPYHFYIKNGFKDTGWDQDGERYLKLLI